MLAMAVAGLLLLRYAVPAEPERSGGRDSRPLSALVALLVRPALRPLYAGIFALHFIITATFLSVPQALVGDLGIASADHWQVYLGVFAVSLVGTVLLILATERSGRGHALFVASVVLAGLSQAALGHDHAHLWRVVVALTLFFTVFNYLEARLPALLTHAAPGTERGAALGIYATAQFLGTFLGGALGGVLLGRYGISGVFWGSAAVALGWAVFASLGAPADAYRHEPA
jgi:predicted MFS family arabinose efflux permease